ncbi:MAG: hypothetical protein M1821_001475 [Bathelium mastoideum]|nr:MAG: hypothetical protein M1821_001475 [Bathelium mastoideum]KAI9690004.1 MAG: hypothetical protein M1822_009886 [Bathelium mastoideum]
MFSFLSALALQLPLSPSDLRALIFAFGVSPLQAVLYILHHVLQSLRAPNAPREPPIRVVCISDTHNLVPSSVPNGDLLIHAGDLTKTGTPSELHAQLTWLASLPHAHKVVVAGNCDSHLDPRSRTTLSLADRSAPLPDWPSLGIHYLQHSTVDLHIFPLSALYIPEKSSGHPPHHAHTPNGGPTPPPRSRSLRIHGAPQVPLRGPPSCAFQYPPAHDAWTDTLPRDVDVVVTHVPPAHHLDRVSGKGAAGDAFLLAELWRVRPRLHVCGHVHAAAGREMLWWDEAQRAYERGCTRRVGWLSKGLLSLSLWMDLGRVLVLGLLGLLWNRVWGGEERNTVLVNAALMEPGKGRLRNKIQIIDV